jgi:hypothetical protein
MKISCPLPAGLPSIATLVDNCPFKLDQVIRAAFQRNQFGVPTFTAAKPITALASWAELIALPETDSKRIVISPIFAGLTIPPSEAKYEGGGDNSTPFGQEQYTGEDAIKVAYQYRNLHPDVVSTLRKLSQYSIPVLGVFALTTFLITKNGQIVAVRVRKDGDVQVAEYTGVAIYNYRVGSRGSEGLNASDIIPAGFGLTAEWDEDIALITPDFNALTAL